MIKYYAINGNIIPKEKAVIGITDLAILRGYGVFDYFVVKQGKPLFFADYLNRFERSAKELNLEIPFSRKELKKQILDLIEANQTKAAGLKLILTGGYSMIDGYSPEKPNLLIIESTAPSYPPSHYEDGVKLMLHEYHRIFPSIKSINYMVGVSLLPQMKAAGAKDVLFHHNGMVHETVRANFFIVKNDDTIVTAEENILAGITRKRTLEVANKYYRIERRDLKLEEIKTAKEAFITSSTIQVMPVIKIDEIPIGSGKPGGVSKHLLHLLQEEEKAYLAAEISV